MLYHIIKTEGDKNEEPGNESSIIDDNVTESLKMKVRFVTLIMKMFRTIREEKELIYKLKGCCPGNKIPKGLIIQGPLALKSAYDRYNKAKVFDVINEMYPDEEKKQIDLQSY